MYRRFDVKKGARQGSGKWKRIARTGVGHVLTESNGDWEIEVSMRRVGSSIRRDVYSVSIRSDSSSHDEFLSGFTSQQAALDSAKQRVDLLEDLQLRARSRVVGIPRPPEH